MNDASDIASEFDIYYERAHVFKNSVFFQRKKIEEKQCKYSINPIPHGIWNNVSTWGGALWPHLVFSALRLPKAQNLVSDKYFDFFLSIDTKNSPLNDILFALRAVE